MDEEPNRKESESGEKGSSDTSNDGDNDSAASGESVREGEATNSDSQMPSDQLRPSASDGDGGKKNGSETVEISDDISSEFAKPLPPQAPPLPAADADNSAELYGSGCDSDRNDDSGKSGDSDRNESENEGMSDAGSNSSSGSHKTKKSNRCQVCRKKVGLTGFMCRCGGLFCSVHRYSDKHSCTFNYRELGAEEIRKNNPVVLGEKIHKI